LRRQRLRSRQRHQRPRSDTSARGSDNTAGGSDACASGSGTGPCGSDACPAGAREASPDVYVVRTGDVLSEIAQRFGLSEAALMARTGSVTATSCSRARSWR